MANKPTKAEYEGFKKAVANPMTPAPIKQKLQSIIDQYSSEYEGGSETPKAQPKSRAGRKPSTTKKYKTLPKPKMVALITATKDAVEDMKAQLKKLGYNPEEVDALNGNQAFAILEELKSKMVGKPKRTATPRATKKTATDIEKAKAEIKAKTGKTEAECEAIIEQYRALRTKAQEGKRKAEQATATNKKRVAKLEDKGDLIEGTNVKTADAVIETTAQDVAEKIEQQIEAVEEKAEKEAVAEVAKDNTKKTPTQKKQAVEAKVEKKVKEKTRVIVKKVVIDTTALLTSIATSLGKFDKDSQKEFLIKLRSDIDKLLAKYAFGGMTDGAVQVMNVQQSNLSSSSVNPTMFAKGGGVEGIGEIEKFFEDDNKKKVNAKSGELVYVNKLYSNGKLTLQRMLSKEKVLKSIERIIEKRNPIIKIIPQGDVYNTKEFNGDILEITYEGNNIRDIYEKVSIYAKGGSTYQGGGDSKLSQLLKEKGISKSDWASMSSDERRKLVGVDNYKRAIGYSKGGSTYQGGGEIKDVSGNYYSTNDFVSVNKLEKEAEKLFGKDWEAEDDMNQLQELIDLKGGGFEVIMSDNDDEWQEFREKYNLKNPTNDSNYDMFVVPISTYQGGGEIGGAKIRIDSVNIDVYEDSYEEGEGRYVNDYSRNDLVGKLVSPKELLNFLSNELYTTNDPSDYAIMDNAIFSSQLVDEDSGTATERQKAEWEKGNLTLYSENIRIGVSIIHPTETTDEELSKLTGIGLYKKGGKVKMSSRFAKGGLTPAVEREKFDKLIGKTNYDEFYFLDDIFTYKDGFKGATGTSIIPVSKEHYDYATSREGILERYMDAMGEEEWLDTLGLDSDDYEDENEMIEAIEEGIYDMYLNGGLDPFEQPNYEIEEQMRGLPEFSDEDKYPIFEVVGGGRIFGKDVKFEKIYNQKLYNQIRKVEEFAKGGKLWIDTKKKGGLKGVKPSRKNTFRNEAVKRGISSGTLASRVIANPSRYKGINPKSAQLVKNMGVRKHGGSIGDILRNRRGE